MTAPAVAYNLNMHVERHAFETYNDFLKSNVDILKSLPAPNIAIEYYQGKDLSLFDAFHHSQLKLDTSNPLNNSALRRPIINNLYDVFYNICLDEAEHAETMNLLSCDISQLRKP
jgi:ubiquinol oxidase